MVIVGITGGIGSGKSTVSKIWQELGAYVLNADDLAKSLMVDDPGIRRDIVNAFGERSYRDDGSLNREWLARQAFDNNRVEELNRIVHPHIPGETENIIAEAEQEGYPVFVYEAALLMENLQPGSLDYLVLVLADRDKRVERVTERDGVEPKDVLNRMKTQKNFEQYRDQADFIIENNGSLEQLKQKARDLYPIFLED